MLPAKSIRQGKKEKDVQYPHDYINVCQYHYSISWTVHGYVSILSWPYMRERERERERERGNTHDYIHKMSMMSLFDLLPDMDMDPF